MRTPSPAPPVAGDHASRFLPVVIAAIVFLAALTLAATVLLSNAVERWTQALAGGFTVQVAPAASETDTDAAVQRAVTLLQEVPGVGPALAVAIHAALHPDAEATGTDGPANGGDVMVNTTTGEILDS